MDRQTLIPGVAPVTDRQRAEARAAKPLRGGDAPPPAGGLFDEAARKQLDLVELAHSAKASLDGIERALDNLEG